MEHAALQFARRVLVAHVLALALVIAVVLLAARGVYQNTRRHAEAQARDRQELLASQTARGIENYYTGIVDQLDLLREAEQRDAPSPAGATAPAILGSPASELKALFFAPILWQQLQGRASHLLAVDRGDSAAGAGEVDPSAVADAPLKIVAEFSDAQAVDARQIVSEMGPWLKSIDAPAISPFAMIGGLGMNLVAVPIDGKQGRVIVAAVPVRRIETTFFNDVNQEETMSATLLDETSNTMVTSDRSLVGVHVDKQLRDPKLRNLLTRLMADGKRQSMLIDQPLDLAGTKLTPRLITAEPIKLPGGGGSGGVGGSGGQTWYILIASHLSEVEAVVSNVFRQAMGWAIFVVVSMTAVLVSTAVQMIRSRVRLERIQSEMLHRELNQAREIQLHWLPAQESPSSLRGIDIAAVNQPASHISGDFYNWFELAGDGGQQGQRVVVTIGDVTGHGMSAAFLMATTQLLVRTTMPRVGDPGKCLEEVNRQLCSQVFHGQFVTMLILVLDLEQGRVDIATAGHPPPLLGDGERFEPMPVEPQLVLGVDGEARYASERFALPPRASLVLYTDGVPDARSAAGGAHFDVDGIRRCLYGRFSSAQLIVDLVVEAIDEFRGPRDLPDDVTLVAVQLLAAEPLPADDDRSAAAAAHRAAAAPECADAPLAPPSPPTPATADNRGLTV